MLKHSQDVYLLYNAKQMDFSLRIISHVAAKLQSRYD
jgi:hypothetical protein